ncbi:MAG: hypothetical protein EHM32_08510 [Spirochaetales bacterium]|nr:MAG: hypothetical protein EHM32_08510 [Spirochaetales bacterium]
MLTITGLDFAELTKFRNEVQNRVRGVKKVYSRGQAGRAAKIEVEFAGKTDDLAQELNAKSKGAWFRYRNKRNLSEQDYDCGEEALKRFNPMQRKKARVHTLAFFR